jgi:hypothetical protein
MCGANESCRCPYDNKPVSLYVDLIRPMAQGAKLEADNLRTICSTCADGLRSAASHTICKHRLVVVTPDRLQLLAQIRRATIDDQKVVFEWLLRKFKLKAGPAD